MSVTWVMKISYNNTIHRPGRYIVLLAQGWVVRGGFNRYGDANFSFDVNNGV